LAQGHIGSDHGTHFKLLHGQVATDGRFDHRFVDLLQSSFNGDVQAFEVECGRFVSVLCLGVVQLLVLVSDVGHGLVCFQFFKAVQVYLAFVEQGFLGGQIDFGGVFLVQLGLQLQLQHAVVQFGDGFALGEILPFLHIGTNDLALHLRAETHLPMGLKGAGELVLLGQGTGLDGENLDRHIVDLFGIGGRRIDFCFVVVEGESSQENEGEGGAEEDYFLCHDLGLLFWD
jgi:hypothetical protein